MNHNIKSLPQYFEAVLNHTKTFEIRENDRDYKVGDTITLHETEHPHRKATALITYLTDFMQKPNYVVFNISDVKELQGDQS